MSFCKPSRAVGVQRSSSEGSTSRALANLRSVSGCAPPRSFSSLEMTLRCTPLSRSRSPMSHSLRWRSVRNLSPSACMCVCVSNVRSVVKSVCKSSIRECQNKCIASTI